jgi:DNA-binding IscR family transcriptional regulator
MEGPLASAPHRSSDNVIARVLGEAWTQMTESQRQQLSNITFDRLVQQAQAETADMYYI